MKVDKKLLMAFLYIALGVLFCVFKNQIIGWLLTSVGAVLIINGIIQFFHKKTEVGSLYIILGIVVIVCGWTLLQIAMVVFGAILLVYAIADYVNSRKNKLDLANLIFSVVVAGLLIFCGFKAIDVLFVILGAALVVEGVLQLLTLIKK